MALSPYKSATGIVNGVTQKKNNRMQTSFMMFIFKMFIFGCVSQERHLLKPQIKPEFINFGIKENYHFTKTILPIVSEVLSLKGHFFFSFPFIFQYFINTYFLPFYTKNLPVLNITS